MNQDSLRMRTVWAERLELPRAAVASLSPLPGWRIVLDEDFHDGLKAFATTGNPELTDAADGKSARALLLRSAGQSLTYNLTRPLAAGRVGINFQERGQTRGALCMLELLWQQGERVRRVTVTVAADGEQYAVDSGGLPGTARQLKRIPGWHRLHVRFSQHSLRLTCDDDVLWHNLDEGPGGTLRRVTIRCQRSDGSASPRGAVAWTDLCIERAVEEHPQPPTDAEQGTIRLLNDDLLYGRILRLDRHVIQIEGRFGKRSLPWAAVSGCSFRRPAAPPKANEGAKVRLLLHSGLCTEPDVLEGVVMRRDERQLVLRHALLGELTFERSRVRELRPIE